jgi:hypothetical protein
MFRRLHFDEAPRASLIRAPLQQGKDQENPEQGELALEFSRLLEQVRGPIAAIHDEVMALGLALAQAIPTIQQLRPEVEAAKDDNREFQQDAESEMALNEGDRDGGERGELRGICVAREGLVRRTDGTQGDDQAHVEDKGDGSAESASDDCGPDIDDDDIEMAIDLLNLEGGKDSGDSASLEAESVSDVTSVQIGTEAASLVGQDEWDSRAGGAEAEQANGEAHEGSLGEEDYVTSADVMANTDEGVVSQRESRISEAAQAVDEQPALATVQAVSGESSGEERATQEGLRADGVDEPLPANERTVRQVEQPGNALRAINTGAEQEEDPAASQSAKAPLASTDPFFQITLLRQAFESFRSHRAGLNEPESHAIMPAVSTAVGVSDARSARQESAPKAARPLDKNVAHRMLERVETALKEAARNRDGKTLSLRLDPAQLGKVKVDVTLREGSLHARITPENQQVLASLRENAHELQAALRRLGLNVDSVSVTVAADATPDTSEFGRELPNGKSYQEQRNNMPNEERQVAENTIGNELAELTTSGVPQKDVAGKDHWVA